MISKLVFFAAIATASIMSGADAQQLPAMTQQTQNIKRTPLQKFDVPGAIPKQ